MLKYMYIVTTQYVAVSYHMHVLESGFDWSFAYHTPVVITISIVLSSTKIQNGARVKFRFHNVMLMA